MELIKIKYKSVFKYDDHQEVIKFDTNGCLKNTSNGKIISFKGDKEIKIEIMSDKVILHNGRKRLFPQITTTAETRFTFGGVSYSVGEGTHRILGLKLQPGDNHLTVTTTGTVTFRYREGDL